MDAGDLLMISASYKTYDLIASENRTHGTMEICHTFCMSEPRFRLQEARRNAGYDSPTDAANALKDINRNTLTSHENGNRAISRKAAEKYSRAFGVAAGWILYGETGEPMMDQNVPLVSWVSAGRLSEDGFAGEILDVVKASGLPDGDWIALKVKGNSMDRISPPDSVIFVNRRDRSLVPNACYVIDDGEGNATYKRYRPGPPPRFEPVSTDSEHEPIFFPNEPTIIGRVRRSMIDM